MCFLFLFSSFFLLAFFYIILHYSFFIWFNLFRFFICLFALFSGAMRFRVAALASGILPTSFSVIWSSGWLDEYVSVVQLFPRASLVDETSLSDASDYCMEVSPG